MESLSLSMFLFLPAPLKVVMIFVGFLSFGAMNVRQAAPMNNAQNNIEAIEVEAIQLEKAPAPVLVPAKVLVAPVAAPKAIKAP